MPDVASMVDCTELGIRTPPTHSDRLRHYGGRKKKYVYKYQAWVRFPDGKILGLHGPFPGAKADITIFRNTLLGYLRLEESVLGDKAYQGGPQTLTPIKLPARSAANPEPTLLPWQKRFNLLIRMRRVHVERVFARMKRFQSLVQIWRHPLEKHHLMVTAIAKMINVELSTEPLFKFTPSYQVFRGHIY